MYNWNVYLEGRMQDMVQEAETQRMLKTALNQARTTTPKRPLRERIGERLILMGWRMMNQLPQEGETCSRLVLSGQKQALVMVEVCA
jgi:hypothetical protein